MELEHREFNVWVVIRPAADVPGQWVAHCLDFDTYSQGDSLDHALKMVHEAAVMVALEDLNRGHDPLTRRAPDDFFGELYGLFDRGEKLSLQELRVAESEHRIVAVATQFELRFERETAEHDMVPLSMRPVPMTIAQRASC